MQSATKSRKAQNELHYIARAQFKATGAILYGVRSGENTYHVTIIKGRVTGCCNATTGEDCKGFTYGKGQCKHAKYVLGLENERVVAEQVAELLPEMAAHDDVQPHVTDSIESGEFADPTSCRYCGARCKGGVCMDCLDIAA